MYGDPFWLKARYAGHCDRCSQPIRKGDRAFFYPRTRTILCAGQDCGEEASRDFQTAAEAEAFG